jgi:hypothetical protein
VEVPRQIAGHLVEAFGKVPEGVFTAPRAQFAGTDVYLVNGHWQLQTPAGWVWFVDEPSELVACRMALRRENSPATYRGSGFRSPPGCPAR